ncbi:hypothetical protein AO726_14935 [Pseudomonas sp. TTU2014-080ASC]|nr:Imm52 family immunity protein [Pseudomonas sp. TTU2014-080ASC]KRW58810.1 hypothetical protein AO726_14935 [Pseudomonas sp. TTU2014-080ASC]
MTRDRLGRDSPPQVLHERASLLRPTDHRLDRHLPPQELNRSDFPDAKELIDIPGRGTVMVNVEQVMDERNRDHSRIVGTHDTKLVELGYLPMFNN